MDALALLLLLSAHPLLPCHAAAALLLPDTLLGTAQAPHWAACQVQHLLLEHRLEGLAEATGCVRHHAGCQPQGCRPSICLLLQQKHLLRLQADC